MSDIRLGEDPEEEALHLYGYRKPDWCTCVFVRNMELMPCIKCGALSPFVYWSVSGFQTSGPLCPACHDEIDDCSPEHGETDERTSWPKEANLQAGGAVSKDTLRDLRWLCSEANEDVTMRLLIILLDERGARGFGMTKARLIARLFEIGVERTPANLSLNAMVSGGLIGFEPVETGNGSLSDYISLTERGIEVAGAVKGLLKADHG